ncbi:MULTISPECIES: PEP-CTERM sorting domain-containing protein [Cyanophyceae]|uniref:PEP-CTERM sorting domain-containing protein n=1 Tax=Cyanophyceae TaxID=3028117 RepID=UPI0016847A2B|nr:MULTISPECIES: PEP-CTERM sorting domain-containing protein [Cyanophyceae]MBD1916783.1 PEP-CTERM sorting domain-containing protein [Phormidium sp. FACHB-77]MBD2029413.1 PEP-CTERM sorting domain-containing protein [Phormidium sp. FACHB-322]MBD2051988.1 PEP-CTERM sorting domain-containing protein [Leptolyngbya sp. FACHB-60]
MKTFTILSSALVLTGLLGSMAPDALAKGGNSKGGSRGGQTSQPTAPLACASGSVTSNPLAGGSSLSYSQCLNPVSGNDVTSSISAELTAFLDSTLGDWVFDGKYEGGRNSSGPNDYGFSWVQTGKGSGTWSLAETVTNPFVISLKAGNAYTAYYFDSSTSFNSGTWATFDQKDLSHASFFVAQGLTPEEPNTTVPEPASTAALVLVGLSAAGLARKKQG